MLVGPRATTHRAHALTSDGTESVPITTDVVSSNLDQGGVLVSDLRQVFWLAKYFHPFKLC
jgi:hypothetical protein